MTLLLLALSACGPATGPQATPVQGPPGRMQAVPLPAGMPATYSASPEPFTQVPFPVPPGLDARLGVYDVPRREIFYYPQVGPGIINVGILTLGQYFYDTVRDIFLYDAWREEQIKLVDGDEVGGFAFFPSFSARHHLYFLGQRDPTLAAQFIGLAYVKYETTATPVFGESGSGEEATSSPSPGASPSPDPSETASPSFSASQYATSSSAPSITVVPGAEIDWYLAKPRFLSKINALAVRHGGLTSINVDGANTAVVFTTTDGGLYLYTPLAPQVVALLPNAAISDNFHAAFAAIDPVWGRFVVWHDTARRGLFTLDLWTGLVDSMPYANLALDAVNVQAPAFVESDPYHVFFAVELADGTFRILCYNLVTEQVTNLTLLNMFLMGFPRKPLEPSWPPW